jgi:hypothetical protein
MLITHVSVNQQAGSQQQRDYESVLERTVENFHKVGNGKENYHIQGKNKPAGADVKQYLPEGKRDLPGTAEGEYDEEHECSRPVRQAVSPFKKKRNLSKGL